MRTPTEVTAPRTFEDLVTLVNRSGRLPRLGDDPPPWAYRGWLLPYVTQLHAVVPAVADRGGYHLRTLEAGKLLDEPIPQVAFGTADEKVYKLLREWSALYTSPLFRLASRYCAATCDLWFVLSAEHGLVAPDQVLAPYDTALTRLTLVERLAWAGRVVEQLGRLGLLGAGQRFRLHAGAAYAEPLAGLIGAELPLRGLPIGRRLAWYRNRLAAD